MGFSIVFFCVWCEIILSLCSNSSNEFSSTDNMEKNNLVPRLSLLSIPRFQHREAEERAPTNGVGRRRPPLAFTRGEGR